MLWIASHARCGDENLHLEKEKERKKGCFELRKPLWYVQPVSKCITCTVKAHAAMSACLFIFQHGKT